MNLSNYVLRDEQASPTRTEVCGCGTIHVSICIVAIMLLVWASCVHADDTTSGPDANVGKIREKLLALGYEVPEANTKIDPSEWKGVHDFAARHFDSKMIIGSTCDVILKHLEATLEPFAMGNEKDGSFETVPLLCQYRLGVSEYGHLRYVIGGCYGKMPLEKVESINESIALELNHIPPGKEISFYVTTEFKGIKSALVESSESRGHISRALFSNKANKPKVWGFVSYRKQELVPKYEKMPCILLKVEDDSIVVAGKFLMVHLWKPEQIYHSKKFRLKYTPEEDGLLFLKKRQAEIVEVRGSKTVPVAYQYGLSNLLQYERVLLTAKGDACEKLEVFRPSKAKLDKDQMYISSIHEAVVSDDLTKVKAYLDEGVDVDQLGVYVHEGATLLHLAAGYGHLEMVKLLLANGADVNAKFHRGLDATPLHLVAESGKTDVARILLANGANVNARRTDKGTPLIAAAFNGRTEFAKLLLNNGADINAKTNADATALYYAAWKDHTDLVKLLLDKGAEVNIKASNGQTPLSVADNPKVIQLLKEAGATYAAQSIHEAVHKDDLAKVKALLDEGVGVDQLGGGKYKDFTPLQLAAGYGHLEMVKLLLADGADVSVKHKTNGVTALFMAAQNGHTETVKALLEKNAEVNIQRKIDGATALWIAATLGHTYIVKALLEKKADFTVEVQGYTALQVARRNGHQEIVTLLQAAGAIR